MDPKKSELNPELKEIYERVMNTQVKDESQPQSTPPPQQQTTPPPPPAAPQPPNPAPQTPVTSTNFVFTGNKVTTPEPMHISQPQAHSGPAKKMSGSIIAILVVILIVVWGLFWAKLFGLI